MGKCVGVRRSVRGDVGGGVGGVGKFCGRCGEVLREVWKSVLGWRGSVGIGVRKCMG